MVSAEEEDRFILCMVHKLGYGCWDELKAAIRGSWRFRFDWFFKSRTPQVPPLSSMALGKGQFSWPTLVSVTGCNQSMLLECQESQGSPLQELSRRCDTLIRLVEKENEEVEAAEKEERKKASKKTGSKPTESSGGGGSRKRKASSGGPPAPTEKKRRGTAAS